MAKKYQGNLPGNVNKDAKYSVIGTHRDEKIRLIYRLSSREEALLTTRTHPTLVKMVNDVKEEHADKPGGHFTSTSTGTSSCRSASRCITTTLVNTLDTSSSNRAS